MYDNEKPTIIEVMLMSFIILVLTIFAVFMGRLVHIKFTAPERNYSYCIENHQTDIVIEGHCKKGEEFFEIIE